MAKRIEKRDVVSPGLLAQREFEKRQEAAGGFDFSLVVAGAFVRGIRDIGYKSTGTALDELIDNSIQAEAANVHIIFGYPATSDAKPDKIAVIDDGHGMDPNMIRVAVLWGGTHRENDRLGFGRYGYGLPSACVSQGKRFSVYSAPEDGALHKVTVDIDEIGAGKYTTKDGRVVVPEAEPAKLPDWVASYVKEKMDGLTHGTVVVIERVDRDRLSWKTRHSLNENLKHHLGLIYRNYLRSTTIFVDGGKVDPIDPLFTTPGFRYYDLPGDNDRAEALAPMQIDVKDRDTGNPVGTLKVRFSYMPPSFTRAAENKFNERGKHNPRFAVRKENNGLIILRKGRQIDVIVARCPWTTFVNYDRNFGIEIDFPPALDEEFSITTAKQQIVLSERMWEILRENGLLKVIEDMRKRVKTAFAADRAAREEEKKRASEQAMEEAQKFKTRKPGEESVEQQKKSQEQFDKEVKERAKVTGMPVEQVERELLSETKGHPFVVKEEELPGAPFFNVRQIGGQRALLLNRAHRFYTDVYAGPDSTPRLRAAMEVLLFVVGDCELDASGDRRTFYETERGEWSKRLSITLDRLSHVHDVDDESSANAVTEEPEDDEVARSAKKT